MLSASATVRSILARLEEEGYVQQPHTSAGRIPTDRGYRFYVDLLLESKRPSRAAEAVVVTWLLVTLLISSRTCRSPARPASIDEAVQ